MSVDIGRWGLVAVVLGAIAWIVPSFLSGPSIVGRSGWGYGGMMGGPGGMMGGHGGMMGGYGSMMGGHGGMMGGYGGMMGGYGGMGTGGYLVGIVSQLGFIVLLLGGAYLLYRTFVTGGDGGLFEPDDTALEELRVAYARGELSDEEFERRKARLQPSGNE
ncbi:MAG: SHOCT domain-containing protein [Halodesulfurarchaeum sp.]